jgi:sugar phosphate isomerase/epimerase
LNDNVFVSTNCFQGNDLDSVLTQATELGITNVELSSGLSASGYSEEILEKHLANFRFIVHNYFPPEKNGLVINLASLDPQIRQASVEFCKSAIKLSKKLGGPVYGVHSGFAYDPSPSDLGQVQTHIDRYPLDAVKMAFTESLIEVLEYAENVGIKLCIENNVMPAFNLIDGENLLDLMASPTDFMEFGEISELNNVGYLLDFAHLNVSSKAMNFSVEEFVHIVSKRVNELHVSGNDGVSDQHGPVGPDEWFLPYLKQFKNIPVSIESFSPTTEDLMNSIEHVTTAITGS